MRSAILLDPGPTDTSPAQAIGVLNGPAPLARSASVGPRGTPAMTLGGKSPATFRPAESREFPSARRTPLPRADPLPQPPPARRLALRQHADAEDAPACPDAGQREAARDHDGQ